MILAVFCSLKKEVDGMGSRPILFIFGLLLVVMTVSFIGSIVAASPSSSATTNQENPTSIAMQVKIFSNPISNNNDVRKQELENDFNKWMRDNWEDISIDRIDTNSNSGFLHIVVLYKRKLK